MSVESRERADALRRAIIQRNGDDSSTIHLIKQNLDLLDPRSYDHSEKLWDAAIVSNRYEVVRAMIDAMGSSTRTSMVLNKAAYYNRAKLFRLFLECLHPTVYDIRVAMETARKRGFVEIVEMAIECGVPQDAVVFGYAVFSSLKMIFLPGKCQPYALQKYHSVLEVCVEHNLMDAAVFEPFMYALWDCAECEQIVNLCLDHIGFDPCWSGIDDAIVDYKEKSVWWLVSPMRTWDMRDSPKQSLTDLLSVLSVCTMRPTKHAKAKQTMWAIAEEVASLDALVLLPPWKTTVSSNYRNSRDYPPLQHFVLDGNLRMLLLCWPYLAKYLPLDKDDDPSRQALLSPPAVAEDGEALRTWLQKVRSHPAVQIALTCQQHGRTEDMRPFFHKVLQSILDANYGVGPWKQTFNEVCGHSLLWLLSFDSDLAVVFLEAIKQAVPAFCPPGEDPDDRSATVLGALISGRLHCLEYKPVQAHLRFFEHQIASLSSTTCYPQEVVLSSFDVVFCKVLRHPQVDVSFLDYFISTHTEESTFIPPHRLCDVTLELLEQADHSRDFVIAMEKFQWMLQYFVQNHSQDLLQQVMNSARYTRIAQSGHAEALRLLHQQHGVVVAPKMSIVTKAFVVACEIGNQTMAEVIAEAVWERDGAQSWLSLLDHRHDAAVYTAEVAAEIYGHVHMKHWLRDRQQRAQQER